MVLLMVTTWYPPEKTEEVNKIYMGLPQKYPADESLGEILVPMGVKATKSGIKVIIIVDVAKGKFEEITELTARMLREFRHIEGYRYKIETLMSQEEALKIAGIPMPT